MAPPSSVPANNGIQLVLQSASNSARMDIPGEWNKNDTLQSVMLSIRDRLFGIDMSQSSLRYLQTVVDSKDWDTTSLKKLGIDHGRTLLILQQTAAPATSTSTAATDVDGDVAMQMESTSNSIDPLESALQQLLDKNFDADTKMAIVTMIKIIDNILSKPNDPKVRTLKLSNAVIQKKIISRPGAVEYLLAAGFTTSETSTPLLSATSEQCLLLPDHANNTTHLTEARKRLVNTALSELHMTVEELPKLKIVTPGVVDAKAKAEPPPPATFDPYKGHRYDAKAAAIGQPSVGPDSTYVSSTESALKEIQSKQARLEQRLQILDDRALVAFLPSSNSTTTTGADAGVASVAVNATLESGGDGSLFAAQWKRQEQDRKQRDEGGFTTKAMRDLQQLKAQKVYASAILRIQFPDGSALSAKFLPKELIAVVRDVILENLILPNLNVELYVTPPRRTLDLRKTLQEEGLVPAAKVFVRWTTSTPPPVCAVGGFLPPELFQATTVTPVIFPESMALEDSKPSAAGGGGGTAKPSGEDALLRRMMGGGSSSSSSKSGGGDKNKKPKWFKG